jgi:hypothetical protein
MANNAEIFSAMQEGSPVRSFIKTILGKVCIEVLDPFSDQASELLLEGDPKKEDSRCIYDVWTTKQEVFFRNRNKSLISLGVLKEYVRSNAPKPRTLEDSTNDELSEIINSKFFTLEAKLNKINSVAVLFRMISLAHELEKSDKIVKAIEARLAEVQSPVEEE